MKVGQQKEEFKPITITLESQEELNWLTKVIGMTSCDAFDGVEEVYEELLGLEGDPNKFEVVHDNIRKSS